MKADFEKLNFTVGPVMSSPEILSIGAQQVPYFRTPAFSELMLENERLIKDFMGADKDARAVFMTGSGTASMEASVMNCLTEKDKALVINGGSFGARFCQICQVHGIPYTAVELSSGKALTVEDLTPYENAGYTAFLVNLHETSTGVLYDLEMISDFCHRNNLFLIVDIISAFLAEEFGMAACGADVAITGSQKALALAPGVSIMVFSPRALQRIAASTTRCIYFDMKDYLKNGERGQTPFTPAVGILTAMHYQLKEIGKIGLAAKRQEIWALAEDFRSKIKDLPLALYADHPSHAVTALQTSGRMGAHDVFAYLSTHYDIFVCPNGGELKDKVFRVGHIGCLTKEDNSVLVSALQDMKERGIL